jgi:hypothetical protein
VTSGATPEAPLRPSDARAAVGTADQRNPPEGVIECDSTRAESKLQLHACRADHRLRPSGVLEIVDVPEPEAGRSQQLYDVSTLGIDYADTYDQETPEVVRAIVGSAPL